MSDNNQPEIATEVEATLRNLDMRLGQLDYFDELFNQSGYSFYPHDAAAQGLEGTLAAASGSQLPNQGGAAEGSTWQQLVGEGSHVGSNIIGEQGTAQQDSQWRSGQGTPPARGSEALQPLGSIHMGFAQQLYADSPVQGGRAASPHMDGGVLWQQEQQPPHLMGPTSTQTQGQGQEAKYHVTQPEGAFVQLQQEDQLQQQQLMREEQSQEPSPAQGRTYSMQALYPSITVYPSAPVLVPQTTSPFTAAPAPQGFPDFREAAGQPHSRGDLPPSSQPLNVGYGGGQLGQSQPLMMKAAGNEATAQLPADVGWTRAWQASQALSPSTGGAGSSAMLVDTPVTYPYPYSDPSQNVLRQFGPSPSQTGKQPASAHVSLPSAGVMQQLQQGSLLEPTHSSNDCCGCLHGAVPPEIDHMIRGAQGLLWSHAIDQAGQASPRTQASVLPLYSGGGDGKAQGSQAAGGETIGDTSSFGGMGGVDTRGARGQRRGRGRGNLGAPSTDLGTVRRSLREDDEHVVRSELAPDERVRFNNRVAQRRYRERQRAEHGALERQVDQLKSQLAELKVQNTELTSKHSMLQHVMAMKDEEMDRLPDSLTEDSKRVKAGSGVYSDTSGKLNPEVIPALRLSVGPAAGKVMQPDDWKRMSVLEARAILHTYIGELAKIFAATGGDLCKAEREHLVTVTREMHELMLWTVRVKPAVMLKSVQDRFAASKDLTEAQARENNLRLLAVIKLTTEQKRQIYYARKLMLEKLAIYHMKLKQMAPHVKTVYEPCVQGTDATGAMLRTEVAVNKLGHLAVRERGVFLEFVTTIVTKVLEPEQFARLIVGAYPLHFDFAYITHVVTQEMSDQVSDAVSSTVTRSILHQDGSIAGDVDFALTPMPVEPADPGACGFVDDVSITNR